MRVSGEPRHETVLVHMILTDQVRPVLAWLEDSTLSVAFADAEGVVSEHEEVDQRTCDCCHPVPIQIGDDIGIGYRDAATIDGRTVRDVAFVTGGVNGQTFATPSTIADEHWFLEGCPFSGPSVTSGDGEIVVAWMEASLEYTRSVESGHSFGDSIPLVGDDAGAPREASIAVIDGRLVVAWVNNAGGHVGVWGLS